MSAVGWTPVGATAGPGFSGAGAAAGPKAHADVRISNMSLILRRLRTGTAYSRTRLVRETGLSKATVSTLVTELVARGLVVEGGPDLSGSVGRPTSTLHVAAEAVAGLGLEISADSLQLSVVDLTGTVVEQLSEHVADASHEPRGVLAHAARMVADALTALRERRVTVPAVVIAQPGVLDYGSGTVRYASSLGWRDIALVPRFTALLADRLGTDVDVPPVVIENDAKLAAVATYRDYADAGVRNLLYLGGGEGIVAGIVADGHLLRGWLGFTGEVGHMPVEPDGLACRCGRRGCWETRLGLEAIIAPYPPSDAIHSAELSLAERIEIMRSRFDAGDAVLAERLGEARTALARGLSILVDVLNPEVIVLSGYLAAFEDVFLAPTVRVLEERRLDARARVRVECSQLGPWAPCLGAALVALEPVLDDPTVVSAPARS